MKRVLVLLGVSLAAWLVAAPLAAWADGPGHWLAGGVAAVLCTVPAAATLMLLRFTENRSPVEALGAVMIAPLLRLVVVCAVGGLVWRAVPEFRAAPLRFGGWVLAFYLLTLVTETALALSGHAVQAVGPAPRSGPDVPSGV